MPRSDLIEYRSGARDARRVDQQMLAYLIAAAHTVAAWTGEAYIYRVGPLGFEVSPERPQYHGGELLAIVRSDAAPRDALERLARCPAKPGPLAHAELPASYVKVDMGDGVVADVRAASGIGAVLRSPERSLGTDVEDGYLAGIMGDVPDWPSPVEEVGLPWDTARYRKGIDAPAHVEEAPGDGEGLDEMDPEVVKTAWKD